MMHGQEPKYEDQDDYCTYFRPEYGNGVTSAPRRDLDRDITRASFVV
jgi:hypothetical protein